MGLKRAIAIVLFFYSCSIGLAQPDKLTFDVITTAQGLSYNGVNCIRQDKEGFMWFGTAAGLNKYNGYTITSFRADPQKAPNKLHNDIIWDILEDQQGRFWVTTLGDGVYQLNKQTQALTSYRLSTYNRVSLYKNTFYSLYAESAAVLWIGSQMGLVRFDLLTKRMRLYPLPAPNEVVFCITQDQAGRLWVGTRMGLYSFDRQTGTYTPVLLPIEAEATQPSQPLVSALYLDPQGILWVGTNANGDTFSNHKSRGQGLFHVDVVRSSRPVVRYNPGGLIEKNIAPNGIVAHAGHVWVATNAGLQRITPGTNQVRTYTADRFSANSLSSSNILALYPDRAGTLWIGTDNGVNHIRNTSKQFFAYQLQPVMPTVRVVENNVTAIVQDTRSTIWLGNTVTGLSRFDISTGQSKPVPADAVRSNRVYAVLEDSHRRLWVSTLEGLHQLDPATGKAITHYPAKIPVQHVAEAPNGQLWIGGNKGIACFDPTTGRYSYQDTAITAGFNFVTDVLVSRDGTLWLAQQGLLQHFIPRTQAQTFYRASVPVRPGELTDQDVTTVFEDSRGFIWVGTGRGGLNCLNPVTGIFTAIVDKKKLAVNSISGIVEDKNENIWVSTENGLFRLDRKTKTFRSYDVTDGLPAMEFHKNSVSRHGALLLFGSSNGFVVFDPDSIRDNLVPPPVYITGFKVQGQPRPLPRGPLLLPYHANAFSFDFVALNYQAPDKSRYSYRLKGVDAQWVASGNRRFASYTALAPGTYVFQVKAANDDEVWNQRGATLTLVIARPWWSRWWAYLLYGLGCVGAAGAVLHYRSRALQQENRRLEDKVTERTRQVQQQKHELEGQRDHLTHTLTVLQTTQAQLIQKEKMASLGELTAGIAHEIQNPLNFVNNFSEVSTELLDELAEEQHKASRDPELEAELVSDLRQNMIKITQHGQRASSIVRGMLEHSHASSGERQPTNLNVLCDEHLRLSYYGLRAKDKNFNAELLTHFAPDLPLVNIVSADLGRVLLNVLSNAFYAVRQRQQTGEIDYLPTVCVATQLVGQQVEIRVQDNGVGISEAIRGKVFQPFFTTKPTGEGTGLGLSLSYDIVTHGHGGTLQVESEVGKGTEVIVLLPV